MHVRDRIDAAALAALRSDIAVEDMEHSHTDFFEIQGAASGAAERAVPVAFDGLAGLFHAAAGDTAVLLLSPWGYEELCARKTYRILGEKLACAGFPCLRFDYPATGQSLGESADLDDNRAWRNGVRRALGELRDLCKPGKVVVIGQGIGAALAADLAGETDLDGLVLLAPVAQGRAYLRELAAWTGMTKPTFLVDASDGPEGGLMAGGFVLSAATVEEVRALNLLKDWKPRAGRVLLVERDGHPGDAKLASNLADAGAAPDRIHFKGYVDYVVDPTLSVVPSEAIEDVHSWLVANFGVSGTEAAGVPPRRELPATLETGDYSQTLLRFGPDRMFFGALTEPKGPRAKTVLLFLNSGYDHSIGWARMNVDFTRALARDGFASLRMDLAGIGESPLWPGQPAQVLYSERQHDDVIAAIDWLAGEYGAQRIVLAGRCSGAYLAIVMASIDPRIAGAFVINPRRIVWDPDEDVDQAVREPIQTLATYGRKIVDRQTAKRIISGDLSLGTAASKLMRSLRIVADRKLAPLLRGLSRHHRLKKVALDRMKILQDSNVSLQLVYSEGDRGLLELANWFGTDYGGLAKYRNVELSFLPDADHNLTPLPARRELLNRLRKFATGFEA